MTEPDNPTTKENSLPSTPPAGPSYATSSASVGYSGFTRPTTKPGLELSLPAEERPVWLYNSILAVGVVTGLVCNLLFSEARGLGLNIFVAMLIFITGWYLIAFRRPLPWWRLASAGVALVYGAAFAFRGSEILRTLNLLLAIGFVGLACTASYKRQVKNAAAIAVDLTQVFFNACIGWIIYITEMPWRSLRPRKESMGAASGILSGLLLSVPFLMVFGFLFARAEVRFEEFFGSFFSTLTQVIFGNFWITFFSGILAVGLLRSSFLSASLTDGADGAIVDRKGRIGPVEAATVLTLLNVLFFTFVITQLPYLFGGRDRVAQTPDLAWSEYARRGFFELSWVAILLIPTLLFFLSSTRPTATGSLKIIRILGATLSLLTAVIIASALQRMLLYTQTFGLTELRIYVSAFIVLVALVIGLLNAFSFTDRLRLFIPNALALGIIFSFGIQIPNVQAMVARDIISRLAAGKDGDEEYLRRLSTDAVPTVLASSLPTEQKKEAVKAILGRKPAIKAGILENPYSAVRAQKIADDSRLLKEND